MEVKPGPFLRTQEECPFDRGTKYKDYMNIFAGPNSVSLQGGVPKERLHSTYKLTTKDGKGPQTNMPKNARIHVIWHKSVVVGALD